MPCPVGETPLHCDLRSPAAPLSRWAPRPRPPSATSPLRAASPRPAGSPSRHFRLLGGCGRVVPVLWESALWQTGGQTGKDLREPPVLLGGAGPCKEQRAGQVARECQSSQGCRRPPVPPALGGVVGVGAKAGGRVGKRRLGAAEAWSLHPMERWAAGPSTGHPALPLEGGLAPGWFPGGGDPAGGPQGPIHPGVPSCKPQGLAQWGAGWGAQA